MAVPSTRPCGLTAALASNLSEVLYMAETRNDVQPATDEDLAKWDHVSRCSPDSSTPVFTRAELRAVLARLAASEARCRELEAAVSRLSVHQPDCTCWCDERNGVPDV